MTKKITHKKTKILLLEDYCALADILQKLAKFCAPSCEFKSVARGKEVIAEIEKGHHYDGIITNYQMPLTDGATVARKIRELGYKGVIVCWSAYTKEEKEKECLDAGMDLFVEKCGKVENASTMLEGFETGEFQKKYTH